MLRSQYTKHSSRFASRLQNVPYTQHQYSQQLCQTLRELSLKGKIQKVKIKTQLCFSFSLVTARSASYNTRTPEWNWSSMKRSIRLAEQLNFSLTSSIWMALHSSLFRTGFLSLVLNKNAAGPAWPCNSCCRLSAAHESFCDEDAPTQIFTFGLIQLQPKTAQGITPLSALNCSVVNANKCPVYLLRCNNESGRG